MIISLWSSSVSVKTFRVVTTFAIIQDIAQHVAGEYASPINY